MVAIASALAQAQGLDTLSAAQRTGSALARLRVGQWARIRTSGDTLIQGWITTSPNLVTLETADGSTIEVPASNVASLWVKDGSYAGRGALIGGAVAGIGLGALAAAAVADSRGDPCPCDPAGFFAVGLVVGGAGGALLGALIGATVPQWQERPGLAVARLQVGQQLRIRTSTGALVQGWISTSPNVVTLRTAQGSTIEVPAPGVDSLWVRGTHARTGALIGGTVAGIGLGAFLASHVDQNNPYNARNTVAGGLGLVGGGAVGALVGALIGAASLKWQLRVP